MAYFMTSGSQYEPSEFDPQDQAWEDWSNDEEESESKCLFCSEISPRPLETFEHMKAHHQFDFQQLKKTLALDFYGCIRLINYIRTQVQQQPEVSPASFLSLNGRESFWNEDGYLQPVLEEDPLLFSFEELDEEVEPSQTNETVNDIPISKLDLSKVETTTELEKQLLKLLRAAQENIINIEGQFDEYRSMVKKTFFDPIAKDHMETPNPAEFDFPATGTAFEGREF